MSTRRKVARFAGVGVVNTLIDLGLYAGLRELGLGLVVANFISTTAGLTFSFFANRSYTFSARTGNPLRQGLLFILTTGVGLWVMQPLAIAAVERWVALPAGALSLLVPKMVGIVVGAVWNYVFYDRLVFRHRPNAVGDDAAAPLARADTPGQEREPGAPGADQ